MAGRRSHRAVLFSLFDLLGLHNLYAHDLHSAPHCCSTFATLACDAERATTCRRAPGSTTAICRGRARGGRYVTPQRAAQWCAVLIWTCATALSPPRVTCACVCTRHSPARPPALPCLPAYACPHVRRAACRCAARDAPTLVQAAGTFLPSFPPSFPPSPPPRPVSCLRCSLVRHHALPPTPCVL